MWNSTNSNPLSHSFPKAFLWAKRRWHVRVRPKAISVLRVIKSIMRALVTPSPVHPLSHSFLQWVPTELLWQAPGWHKQCRHLQDIPWRLGSPARAGVVLFFSLFFVCILNSLIRNEWMNEWLQELRNLSTETQDEKSPYFKKKKVPIGHEAYPII